MAFSVGEAVEYNAKADGKLWKRSELPQPLDVPDEPANSKGFALAVAAFQSATGLRVDGKLGPNTLAAMRAFRPYCEDGHGDCADDEMDEPDTGAADPDPAPRPAARTNVSNTLIVNGAKVPLPKAALDLGITCSNWKADDDKHFEFRKRKVPMAHFVLHESVTTSVASTLRVLDAKRSRKGYDYGIHFTLAADGHIHQHNDPVLHRLVHASQLNDTSAGIEITNPYNPRFGGAPWTNVIDGPWWCWKPKKGAKVYTVPTPAQLRAITPLCELLAETCPDLPLAFPTASLGPTRPRIKGWSDGALPGAGIVAHRDFAGHSDGRYLLEHVMERLDR